MAITLKVKIENDIMPFNLGLMVFIDGVVQTFSLNSSKDYDTINNISVNAYENKIVECKFEPNIGQKGIESTLFVVSMLNPDYMPEPTPHGNYVFTNNHKISELSPFVLEYNQSPKLMKTKIRDSYMMLEDEQNSSDETVDPVTKFWGYFENENQSINSYKYTAENSPNYSIKGQGTDCEYIATVFVDHTPVTVCDGYSFSKIILKEKHISSDKYVIDTPITKSSIIYAILIPVGKYDYLKSYPLKTDTQVIVVE